MIRLFLDDYRVPPDVFLYIKDQVYLNKDWVIVKNYKEFCNQIILAWEHDGWPKLISFDHDLADDHYFPLEDSENYKRIETQEQLDKFYEENFKEKTGYDCAKFLIEYCMDNKELKLPKFLCHSMNPSGKVNILSVLNNFKKHQENENMGH